MRDIGNEPHCKVVEWDPPRQRRILDDSQNGNVNFSRRLTVSETRKESGSDDHGHQWGHQEGREGGKNLSKTVDSIKELVTDKEKSNGKGQEDLLADYGDSGKDSEESIGGIDLLRDAGNQNKQSTGSCLFKKAPTLVDEPFEPLPHEVGLYDSQVTPDMSQLNLGGRNLKGHVNESTNKGCQPTTTGPLQETFTMGLNKLGRTTWKRRARAGQVLPLEHSTDQLEKRKNLGIGGKKGQRSGVKKGKKLERCEGDRERNDDDGKLEDKQNGSGEAAASSQPHRPQ
jgi:hypothetical protein